MTDLSVLRKQIKDLLENLLVSNKIVCKYLTVNTKQSSTSDGDFMVPTGCHAAVDQKVLSSLRDQLCLQLQSSGIPVAKVSGDKWNSFCIHLNRTACFKALITTVLDQGSRYGHCLSQASSKRVLLNGVSPHTKPTITTDDGITLDWVRLQVIQQHLHLLLKAHGYTVSSLSQGADAAPTQNLMKTLGVDPDTFLQINNDLANSDTVTHLQQHSHVTKIEWESRNRTNSFPCNSPGKSKESTPDGGPGEVTEEEGSGEGSVCERLDGSGSPQQYCQSVFDMKKYVTDSRLPTGKTNFDQNLTVCNVTTSDKPSDICRQVCSLESALQESGSSVCVHVVGQSLCFQQQKVHLMLRAAGEGAESSLKQAHLVYGPVTPRKDSTGGEVTNATQYISLRYKQMHEAAVMKYGEAVKGAGWENTLQSLTAACIKFELLCTVARNTVKLSLSQGEEESGGELTAGGSFVMYNCARLATLFAHFQRAVEKGTYPALPSIQEIDWKALREDQEWGLLFDYVYVFPEVVQQSVQDLTPRDSIHIKVSTHKVCVFLCSLSRSLSSFYSRYHVLGEARPHLLPTMFARLYLLKAIHQVMVNGLALLGIQPLDQL